MTEFDAYLDLIGHIDELVASFEQHPDELTRERAIALLGGLDAMHRQGLRRLVDGLREAGGQALIDRLAADPFVEILLGLYDFVQLDLPEESPPRTGAGFVPLDDVTLLQPMGGDMKSGEADGARGSDDA